MGVQMLRGQAGYAVVLVRVPLKHKGKETALFLQPHNASSFDFLMLSGLFCNFSNIMVEILPKNISANTIIYM